MTALSTLRDSYDSVVVGSGPAGAMAALHAAQRGRVLLVEAAAMPRDKSCGGMLHEHAERFLSAYAHIPESLRLDPGSVHFRFHDWDRNIRKPTTLRFANVDRRGFDQWLMSLLPDAVTVADTVSLTGFAEDTRGVTCQLKNSQTSSEARCENLVGCDGPRSTVRRVLGVKSAPHYVTLQDFCALDGAIAPFFDCMYTRDVGDSFAYAYVVPKGEVAIVGSVFYPKTKRPHEKHERVLDVLRDRMPLGTSEKREAWVALSVRQREDVVCGRGRVLLAGEAGGFLSPTSGEGISYALQTGRLAGQAIASASPATALRSYHASTRPIADNIARKLRWLPLMESRAGKYLAGFAPAPIVSRVTLGL